MRFKRVCNGFRQPRATHHHTAGKLARRYWDVVGKPNKTLLVSREHSYHGMHALGTSLVGMPAMRTGTLPRKCGSWVRYGV